MEATGIEGLKPIENWQIQHTTEEMALGRSLVKSVLPYVEFEERANPDLFESHIAGLTVLRHEVELMSSLPELYDTDRAAFFERREQALEVERLAPDFMEDSRRATRVCMVMTAWASSLHNALVLPTEAAQMSSLASLAAKEEEDGVRAMLQESAAEHGGVALSANSLFALMNENSLRVLAFNLMLDSYLCMRFSRDIKYDGLRFRDASLQMFDTAIPIEQRSRMVTLGMREVSRAIVKYPELQQRAVESMQQSKGVGIVCEGAVKSRQVRSEHILKSQREEARQKCVEYEEVVAANTMSGKELRASEYMPLFSSLVGPNAPVFDGQQLDKTTARWLVESVRIVADLTEKGSNIEESMAALLHKLRIEDAPMQLYLNVWYRLPDSERAHCTLDATNSIRYRLLWLGKHWHDIVPLLDTYLPHLKPYGDRLAVMVGAKPKITR